VTAAEVLHVGATLQWLRSWAGVHRDGLLVAAVLVLALTLPVTALHGSAWAQSPPTPGQPDAGSGFVQQIVPVDPGGPFPTDNYDIG
jgi:hypothetical protein